MELSIKSTSVMCKARVFEDTCKLKFNLDDRETLPLNPEAMTKRTNKTTTSKSHVTYEMDKVSSIRAVSTSYRKAVATYKMDLETAKLVLVGLAFSTDTDRLLATQGKHDRMKSALLDYYYGVYGVENDELLTELNTHSHVKSQLSTANLKEAGERI